MCSSSTSHFHECLHITEYCEHKQWKSSLLLGIEPLKGCTVGNHVILGHLVNRTDMLEDAGRMKQGEDKSVWIYIRLLRAVGSILCSLTEFCLEFCKLFGFSVPFWRCQWKHYNGCWWRIFEIMSSRRKQENYFSTL